MAGPKKESLSAYR